MGWPAALVSGIGQGVGMGTMSIGGGFLQNYWNKKAAARAQGFSEAMSNSAYQRMMIDLKKAGLNPMLAFSQGGASTPMGQSYSADNPMDGAAASAKQMSMMTADVKKTNADAKLSGEMANTEKTKQDLNRAYETIANVEKLIKENEEAKTSASAYIRKLYPRATGWIDYTTEKLKELAPYLGAGAIGMITRKVLQKGMSAAPGILTSPELSKVQKILIQNK